MGVSDAYFSVRPAVRVLGVVVASGEEVSRSGAPDSARPGRPAVVVALVGWEGEVSVPSGEEFRAEAPAVVDPLLTSAQVAEWLGIGPATWRGYVLRGSAPPPDDRDEDRPVNLRIHRWRTSTIARYVAGRRSGAGKRG